MSKEVSVDKNIEPTFIHFDYPDDGESFPEPEYVEDNGNVEIRARGITTTEEPEVDRLRPNQIVGLIELFRDNEQCIEEIMLTREQIVDLLRDMRRVKRMYPETSY